jgi:DNA-binding response OmpR family regulator
MPADERSPLIACVDSSEDIAELLADYLRLEGFRAVVHTTPVRFGPASVIAFVQNVQPDVCIYTVALPYDESWREFQALRAAVPNVPFVITTTNKRALEEVAGVDEGIELLGKPFDLDEVCRAVRRALGDRGGA